MTADEHYLIIDTSGKRGLVAIADGERVLREKPLDASRQHARDLAGVIIELTGFVGKKVREITGVIVSVGPGSYTGLRVGIISAKTLAYATGCRLIAVPTFHAIAHAVRERGTIEVIADAQQGKVYSQRFDVATMGELTVRPFDEWAKSLDSETWITGPGIAHFEKSMPASAKCVEVELRNVSVTSLYEVGRTLPDADLWTVEPLYLRVSSAEEKANAREKGPVT